MKWLIIVVILCAAFSIELVRMNIEKNAISVKDQAFGQILSVDRIVVTKRGKLVLSASRYGQPTGEVYGSSSLLRPGVYHNVDIDLTYLDDPSLKKVAPGDEVVAVLYDVSKDYSTLTPQKTIFGNFISKRFRLL